MQLYLKNKTKFALMDMNYQYNYTIARYWLDFLLSKPTVYISLFMQ